MWDGVSECIYNFLGVGFVAEFDADVGIWEALFWLDGCGLLISFWDVGDFDEGGFGLRHCFSHLWMYT